MTDSFVINVPKIKSMRSPRGNEVPNQYIIRGEDYTAFQSYDSIIAVKMDGEVYISKRYWDYSRTTGKYRNEFLREDKRTTEKKIEDGTYELVEFSHNNTRASPW